MFAKLTGNHHLMANIFNFHKNETFGVLKMHNMSKIWFANNKFSFWKNLVYDFLIFVFFIFPNFNWLFSKILVSKGSYEVLVRQNIFDPHTFDNEMTAPLKFQRKFILFLHERNITTSLLITHLICTVVHYANLNLSSINKAIFTDRWIFYFVFFDFLFMFILTNLLSKILWEKQLF